MRYILLLIALMLSFPAFAAQYGKVVVDQANVYEFPQARSKVVGKAMKDEVMVVSNIATEGFYKVRTSTGDLGWVSGNDMFVAKVLENNTPIPEVSTPATTPAGPGAKARETPIPTEDTTPSYVEHSRVIFAGGMHSLSYAGTPDGFNGKTLNLGWDGLAECQFKIAKILFWAVRAEFLTATSGPLLMGSGITHDLSYSSIPVQIGFQISPITARRFRFGMGVYAGAAYSTIGIHQTYTTRTGVDGPDFHSLDPTATANFQMNIGLSDHAGIFFEGAYRYEKSAVAPSDVFLGGTGLFQGINSFQVDYSGIIGRVGIEFRI